MTDINDILATAKLPEQTVTLCVRGDLIAKHAELTKALADLGEYDPSSIGEENPRHALAADIVALEAEMKATEVSFTFRALGRRRYRELIEAHPSPDPDTRFEIVGFSRDLIAACCVEPAMTPNDLDRLCDVLNDFAYDVLFIAAFGVNEGPTRIPFSAAASELTAKPQPS